MYLDTLGKDYDAEVHRWREVIEKNMARSQVCTAMILCCLFSYCQCYQESVCEQAGTKTSCADTLPVQATDSGMEQEVISSKVHSAGTTFPGAPTSEDLCAHANSSSVQGVPTR